MSESERVLPSVQTLKSEVRELIERSREYGPPLPLKIAYERLAHHYGFRDWNACVAASKATDSTNAEVQQVNRLEVPPFLGRFSSMPDDQRLAVSNLLSWAKRLDALATYTSPVAYPELIPQLAGPRPYIFEKNDSRWSDGLYHLVDRHYQAWPGVALSDAELSSAGVREWAASGYCALAASDAIPVLDERVQQVIDRPGLKRLAKLLLNIAEAVDARAVPAAHAAA